MQAIKQQAAPRGRPSALRISTAGLQIMLGTAKFKKGETTYPFFAGAAPSPLPQLSKNGRASFSPIRYDENVDRR